MTGRDRGAQGADLLGAGLIVLTAACFATLGPLSRFADDAGVDPLTLVTWRAGIGAVVIAAFIGLRMIVSGVGPVSLRAVPARDRWFIVAGAFANAILNLAAFIAFGEISIALTLLVFYLYPAGVAVVSAIWFGERLDGVRWAALVVSLLGTALVVAGAGPLGGINPLGIGLAFVAGMAQVFYVIAARHGFAHVPGPQAAAMTMGGATVVYILIGVLLGSIGDLSRPLASAAAITPVMLAGVIGAGIPTVAFILGIRRLGAPRAAILATLEPIIGVGLAAWLLAESPTGLQIAGGALILASAVLLQLRFGPTGEREAVLTDADAEEAHVQPR
jgi:drug/metabolite transporter (DMT)-like permease